MRTTLRFLYARAILAAVLVAASITFANPVNADTPPLIPRDVLFGNPVNSSPLISPDGKLIAYVAPHDGVMNVWVRTLGKNDDRVVTEERKRGVQAGSPSLAQAVYWQPDSAHILYLQDNDGDENWHIYQSDINTRETRDLTPFKDVRAEVVAISNDHDFMLVALNKRDPKLSDVYRLNYHTQALELDTQNPGDVSYWQADKDMHIRAANVALPDGGTELRLRQSPQSDWVSSYKWPFGDTGGSWEFAGDGKSLMIYSDADANAVRLLQLDTESGKSKLIDQDPQYDITDALFNPETRAVQAVAYDRDRLEWKVLDPSVSADFAALTKIRDGDFSIVSRDKTDKTWVVKYVDDDAPTSWYVYDRVRRSANLLFTDFPALEKYKLAAMRPVTFKARDGVELHGYLTIPPGTRGKNVPMVLQVHGGPWVRDHWGLDRRVQWLANRGYAVLQVNFRGSTGYGKAFTNLGDREWGAKMLDDLIDAKHWAIVEGYADPERVVIFGRSYGGYATLSALAFRPEEFTAGISVVGPSNLNTLMAGFPAYWQPFLANWRKRVGDNEAFLNSRSPLFQADKIVRPLLIAQGANDVRVKQSESDSIAAAVRKNGKPVEYFVYTDEGHGIPGYGFVRPENEMHFRGKVETFLARHLGGRAEPEKPVPGNAAVEH